MLDLNPTMGSGYIVMNLEAPFLSDPNFRMALAYATNREHIVEVGMDGVAKVSSLLWDERTAGIPANTQHLSLIWIRQRVSGKD